MPRRPFLFLCCALLLLAACTRQADVAQPRLFREGGVGFDYPGNWKISKNEATSYGRLIFVEEPGHAIAILAVYGPGFDADLDEYSASFKQNLGAAVPFHLVKNAASSKSAAGVDCKFSLQIAGIKVPHTANLTRHAWGDWKVICVTQVADEDRHLVAPGFDLIRRTLAPTAAAAAEPRAVAIPPPVKDDWKKNRSLFLARMDLVQKGWSEARLLELAGEPESKSDGRWYYKWIENRVFGGYYETFVFTLGDGAVTAIEHQGGHETRGPAPR